MAEPTEMQFGMLSWVDPRNVLLGVIDAPTGMGTFRGVWPLKCIVKHRILGVG